jgi:hypothetical protein
VRFIILVKTTKESEAGAMPTEEMLTEVVHYHEQLAEGGALHDATGLKPTSQVGASDTPAMPRP